MIIAHDNPLFLVLYLSLTIIIVVLVIIIIYIYIFLLSPFVKPALKLNFYIFNRQLNFEKINDLVCLF